MVEGDNSRIRAEAGGHQTGRSLGKTQCRLGIHFMVKRRYKARIKGVTASRGVDDPDVIGRRLQPRAVAVRVEGSVATQCKHAARSTAIKRSRLSRLAW